MTYVVAIFTGLLVGILARFVLPGKQEMGWIMTALLGIAGSFAAKYAGIALGFYKDGQPAGWIMSIIGAVILLVVYERLVKKSGGSDPAA
jgi:uncharacterized membrane protein YeaQ/YmgE (transglycosylase-associated protein family)